MRLRHGAPAELLSDCGANLLSTLLVDLCRLLGMKEVNTTTSYTWHNLGYLDTGAVHFQWCMDHGSQHLAIAITV